MVEFNTLKYSIYAKKWNKNHLLNMSCFFRGNLVAKHPVIKIGYYRIISSTNLKERAGPFTRVSEGHSLLCGSVCGTICDSLLNATFKPHPHLRTFCVANTVGNIFCVWAGSNSRTKQCWQQCFVKMSLDADGALLYLGCLVRIWVTRRNNPTDGSSTSEMKPRPMKIMIWQLNLHRSQLYGDPTNFIYTNAHENTPRSVSTSESISVRFYINQLFPRVLSGYLCERS